MSFPHKEELILLEQLAQRTRRIYDDAVDIGVPFSEVTQEHWQAARTLAAFYKDAGIGYRQRKWHQGGSAEWFIPIERDGAYYGGADVCIMVHRDQRVAGGGFISIAVQYGQVRPCCA